jgi:hypothetical protein
MLSRVSRLGIAFTWSTAVVVLAVSSVFLGFGFNSNIAVLWLVACLIPPAVMLLVWPSAPPLTVAELLYAVDNPPTQGQR